MKLKKIHNVALFAASLLIVPGYFSEAFAELKLPSGSDRPPNVSVDPFERAREAVKNLPGTQEQTQPAEEKQQQPPPPVQQRPVVSTETPAENFVQSQEDEGEAEPKFEQEIVFTGDWFAKLSGGVPPPEPTTANEPVQDPGSSAMMGLMEYLAEVHTGPLGLWKNGKLFLHLAFVYENKSPSEFVGDIDGLSGNDAGGNMVKLWEGYYEQSFPESHSSILAGIYDWNSEFYVSEYANLFLNGSIGMGNAVSYAANPSTYPTTSFGVRLKVDLNPNLYLMMSAHDGVPGPTSSFVDLTANRNEGVFSSVEFGLHKNEPGSDDGYYKLSFGGWYLKQQINEMTGVDPDSGLDSGGDPNDPLDSRPVFNPRPGNAGVYLVAETSIGKTLGIFGKLGRASEALNRYPEFYAAGINYTGLIPGRESDVLGLAVMQTNQGKTFLEVNPLEDPADDTTVFFTKEVVYEATYSTQLTDWLMIQPDVQFVLQPGMSQLNGNAWVIGLRAQAVY